MGVGGREGKKRGAGEARKMEVEKGKRGRSGRRVVEGGEGGKGKQNKRKGGHRKGIKLSRKLSLDNLLPTNQQLKIL